MSSVPGSSDAAASPRASMRPSLAPLTGNLSPGSLSQMPPSDMNSVSIMLKETSNSLERIWQLVGYSQAEKAAQVGALVGAVKEHCQRKVQEENAVMEEFKHSIDQHKVEIRETSKAMGRPVPGGVFDGSNGTLTEVLERLSEIVEQLRTDASGARSRIAAAREIILNSHAALGTEAPAKFHKGEEEDLKEDRVKEFELEASDVQVSVKTRLSTVISLVTSCQNLLRELCIEADLSELDRKIMGSLVDGKDGPEMQSMVETETCVGIGGKALQELTGRVGELQGEKKRRKVRLGELGQEIANLWEKLKVPESTQQEFTASVQGLGMDTIMKGEVEVKRLKELKSEMRGKLIEEARERIVQLWEETNASQAVRDAFEALKTTDPDSFTDALLQQHDEEITVLEARLDQMRPMLRMIEKREEVVAERSRYEELQKDPDRLKQRGGALTKQLMMEEKMQKRIKKDLPKYTEALKKKMREWRRDTGEGFLYKGDEYENIMNKQEDEWRAYKDAEAAAKLQKKQEEKARYSGVGAKLTLPGQKKKSKKRVPLKDGSNAV